MSRAEALVRQLCERGAYDHRSAKLVFEMFGVANYRQGELRKEEARAEEARLQRERDKELLRERALRRAEEEALEQRRQKNLRRRERAAERRAAQVAAETARPLREAAEANVADWEDPPQSSREQGLGAECPPGGGEGVPEPVEDARLYGEAYRQSLAAARKPKARPVTPPADADQAEGAPVPAAISAPPRPVRRSASVRRPSGPLIASTQPLVGHSLGLSGTSKPPPRQMN